MSVNTGLVVISVNSTILMGTKMECISKRDTAINIQNAKTPKMYVMVFIVGRHNVKVSGGGWPTQGSCKPVKCDCLNGHSRQTS